MSNTCWFLLALLPKLLIYVGSGCCFNTEPMYSNRYSFKIGLVNSHFDLQPRFWSPMWTRLFGLFGQSRLQWYCFAWVILDFQCILLLLRIRRHPWNLRNQLACHMRSLKHLTEPLEINAFSDVDLGPPQCQPQCQIIRGRRWHAPWASSILWRQSDGEWSENNDWWLWQTDKWEQSDGEWSENNDWWRWHAPWASSILWRQSDGEWSENNDLICIEHPWNKPISRSNSN